jgi:hypothetical protein
MKHEIHERMWRNRHYFRWFAEIVGGTSEEPGTNREPLVVDIPSEYIHQDGGVQVPEEASIQVKQAYQRLQELDNNVSFMSDISFPNEKIQKYLLV